MTEALWAALGGDNLMGREVRGRTQLGMEVPKLLEDVQVPPSLLPRLLPWSWGHGCHGPFICVGQGL